MNQTFEEFIEKPLRDSVIQIEVEDEAKELAMLTWNHQRQLAQPMADAIDKLSAAMGSLPLPMAIAVMRWKGIEVPQEMLDAMQPPLIEVVEPELSEDTALAPASDPAAVPDAAQSQSAPASTPIESADNAGAAPTTANGNVATPAAAPAASADAKACFTPGSAAAD